jgi:hypothetical protein
LIANQCLHHASKEMRRQLSQHRHMARDRSPTSPHSLQRRRNRSLRPLQVLG